MNPSAQKILTVDDDQDILKLLGMRLKAAGYQVVSAKTGEEALAQIAVSRPSLVISDLRMPDMDGLALFDAIHQSDPALPLIMRTCSLGVWKCQGTLHPAVALPMISAPLELDGSPCSTAPVMHVGKFGKLANF